MLRGDPQPEVCGPLVSVRVIAGIA